MVRIQSTNVARILSRFRKPRLDLDTHFDVPASLYQRIEAYARSDAKNANYKALNVSKGSSQTAPDSLNDLFELSKGSRQKVSIGSLLLEHGVSLPLRLDMHYLRALVQVGLVPQAVRLWRQRVVTTVEERKEWNNFGIELFCLSFRPQVAETSATKTTLTQFICLQLILVYSQLRQAGNVRKWCKILFGLHPSKEKANHALKILIDAKLWDEVQDCLSNMNRQRLAIDPSLTAACFTAASKRPIESVALVQVAALLGSDGGLVNIPKFRKAITATTNETTQITNLLHENNSYEAVNMFKEYKGPNTIALATKLLSVASDTATNASIKTEILDLIAQKMSGVNENSSYIRFMLDYYIMTDTAKASQFIQDHRLFSTTPVATDGSPSKSCYNSYYKLWRIVLQSSKTQKSFLDSVDIRDLSIVTTSNVALQPPLLALMILCFNLLPDLPGLTSLLMFAQEACNVCVDPTKIFPGSIRTISNAVGSDWRTVAKLFITEHQQLDDTTSDKIIDEGVEFRKLLQI